MCNVLKNKYLSNIFLLNEGSCVYYPSNIFGNMQGFKNWVLLWVTPEFQLGNIWSCDAFKPIACDRKYFMDYN